MTLTLLAVYIALAASLMRAVLVKLQIAPPLCGHCGRVRERRELGESICRCSR